MKIPRSFWFPSILLALSAHARSAEVVSSADGSYTTATTWSPAGAPAAGNNYTITHTVGAPDNTVTLAGDKITVGTGGTLTWTATTQTAYTLTANNLTLDGGKIQFNSGGGYPQYSRTHQLANVLSVSSASALQIGTATPNQSYDTSVKLNGGISGAGRLDFVASMKAGVTANLQAPVAGSAYSGNWTVGASGAGNANLNPTAAGALGTGTVTLGTRGILTTGAAGGINSLAGVAVNGTGAVLNLNGHNWTNTAASLTVSNGTAKIGSVGAGIGSLTLDGGTIDVQCGDGLPTPIQVSGGATYTAGGISVALQTITPGVTYNLLHYGGTLTGTPAVTFSGGTPAA